MVVGSVMRDATKWATELSYAGVGGQAIAQGRRRVGPPQTRNSWCVAPHLERFAAPTAVGVILAEQAGRYECARGQKNWVKTTAR